MKDHLWGKGLFSSAINKTKQPIGKEIGPKLVQWHCATGLIQPIGK